MKKTVLAVAALAMIGLGGYQLAEARPAGGGPGQGQMSEETLKAREKFFNETAELRKKMFSKKTELQAVLNGETPDEKKAAKLSEELFDLRDQMHKQAQNAGLAKAGFGCGGPGGMGPGMGMEMGKGMGKGMGPGAQQRFCRW